MELLGYLENWGPDVKWWDNNLPGNCLMGCIKAEPFLQKVKPYSSINYGFSFLTTKPDPDQDGCGTEKPAGPCNQWAGDNIYLAEAGKQGSIAVNDATTIQEVSPSIIAIADVVRMGRMHPDGPKRVKIVLGGWSDFARMGTAENGAKAAKLMAKFTEFTFADGVDIDMEHLTPFNDMGNEFEALQSFISTLSEEFEAVSGRWADTAMARKSALQSEYDGLEDWEKTNVKQFYETTMNYLDEVAQNPVPKLEISWTTRFNAFLPEGDKWNYLQPDSGQMTEPFATDDEGRNLWPEVGDLIDTVNVMAYDAGTPDGGTLHFNFSTIISNFVEQGGVPARKINMGFEAGEQAAGGIWEGLDEDKEAGQMIVDRNSGGGMVWAINPDPSQHPEAATQCPILADALAEILKPEYAWGPAPTYTKCDSQGWWPGLSASEELFV